MLLQKERISEYEIAQLRDRERCHTPIVRRVYPAKDRQLLKRAQEFQPEDTHVAQNLLAAHLGHNRRGLGWY